MNTRLALLAITVVATAVGLVVTNSDARAGSSQKAKPTTLPKQDQVASDIAKTPGCQGVRMLEADDGTKIYFVWFKNKTAALTWYDNAFHQAAMTLMKQSFPTQIIRKPLRHVQDKDKPILVVASLRHADRAKMKAGEFPFVQLSMEMYKPLPGGMSFGGRFAPADVEIPQLTEYGRND